MRLTSLFLIIALVICAQGQTDNEIVNNYLERFIENTEDEVDIQQYATQLLHWLERPMDLNKASVLELYNSPLLSVGQAQEISEHRGEFGHFIDINELQTLPSFSTAFIRQILPFITIEHQPIYDLNLRDIWSGGEHQIMALIETNKPDNAGYRIADTAGQNFDGRHYAGEPVYTNLRYRFDYENQVSFGFNAEKDAGESIWQKETFVGYDYYSFYLSVKNLGKINALQLGDFQANFAQGLTLATGLGFGKSSIITNVKRTTNSFGAYRSMRENAYLRGCAIALQFNQLEIGAFISNKKIDGNGVHREDGLGQEPNSFTSIQEDGGLHRTHSELADKNQLSDLQTGAFVSWKFDRGLVSTIHHLRRFDKPLIPSARPDNQFDFAGNQYSKHGFSYDLVYGVTNFFGEVCYASNQSSAIASGLLASLTHNLDLSLLYRNYAKNFIGMQANGFGETSNTSNEKGLFLGVELQPYHRMRISAYYDLYRFEWLRFSALAPSSGKDAWIEVNYKQRKRWEIYYRFRTETKQKSSPGGNIHLMTNLTFQRHRIHSSLNVNKKLTFRTRFEWNVYHEQEQSAGSLVYQDVIYKPLDAKFHFSFRLASSQIDDINNRIYSFEHVPLYDYPMHQHAYSGMRSYLMIRYLPNRNLNFWFRYAITNFDEDLTTLESIQTIGSGLDETIGPNRHIFTAQLRYKIR